MNELRKLGVLTIIILIGFGFYSYFNYPKNQNYQDDGFIEGFQQVDSYPLFVARYVGDYRFNDYLETGRRPSLNFFSCTCFADGYLVGRNFDFPANPALLLFTSPADGYKSVSMVDLGYFGFSMSENPTGFDGLREVPYMPFDGMNEKGLVVTMAAIPYANPPSDKEKSVGEIEAIRLLLDYAANVDEAIELLSGYNVLMADPPIHYLVADSNGESVIIEFIDNDMKTYRSTDYGIITNFITTGLNLPIDSPCNRYNTVYSGLLEGGVISKEIVFNLLDNSSQSNTIWSCVYDIENRTVHIVMGRNFESVYSFSLEP